MFSCVYQRCFKGNASLTCLMRLFVSPLAACFFFFTVLNVYYLLLFLDTEASSS